MTQAGIDPHYHDPNDVPSLEDLGVQYLGGGEWELPPCAQIEDLSGDDWLLTLADGTEYRLWSKESELGAGSEDLLDKIFDKISPEELENRSFEDIRSAIVAINEDLSRQGRGLSEEEIEEAAADIVYMNRETKPFEEAGHWWQDENIKLIKKAGTTYALSGWTGKEFTECWKCGGESETEAEGSYTITPVYNIISDEEVDLIDYKVVENL